MDRTDGQNRRYAYLRWTTENGRAEESIGFVTEEEAEKKRGDLEAHLRLGTASSPSTIGAGPPTVDRLVREYLRVLEDGKGRGTPRYRRHEFLHCTRIGTHLGRLAAHRVTEAHIRRMVTDLLAEVPEIPTDPRERKNRERGIGKKSSVLDLLGCLRRVYRAGRDAGLVDCEPPRVPRGMLPDDGRPARQLTEGEIGRLVEAAGRLRSTDPTFPARFARMLLFVAWCPRRPVAIFDIRREDCARVLDKRTRRKDVKLFVRRDKAGRGRGWCPLTEPALAVLREQLAAMEDTRPDALVWTSATSGPCAAELIDEPFARACALAGLEDVNLYDLRKFGATSVFARCLDLHVTAEYTGHEDVNTLLLRYISAPKGKADEIAARITWAPPELRAVEDGEDDPE